MNIIHAILGHPLTRGLSVDDPQTTLLRRSIIREKAFLRALYSEWYQRIIGTLAATNDVLELGSGAGFLQQLLPGVITSEVFETPGVKLVADACDLPLADNSLDAVVMTNVFHHIPDVRRFLLEAGRCIRPGGQIAMIEPWRTPWSEWVYTHLHAEPFSPEAGWDIPNTGPLSGANGALPWIVFQRDRALFEVRYPQWQIKHVVPMMPFSHLFSGGVSRRSLMPGWMYRPIRACERVLCETHCAMFALIVITATPSTRPRN